MAFVPCPNTAKVVVRMHSTAGQCYNIFHFQQPGAIDQSDLDALANKINGLWAAQMMPLISQEYYLDQVDAIDLTTQAGPEGNDINAPAVPGSLTGAPVPSGIAIVVTKHTALRGRSYRGRAYIAGQNQSWLGLPGQTSPTYTGPLVTALLNVLTDSTLTPFVAGIVSYFLNKVARSVAHFEPITALSADTSWDSQRRRAQGRGA